MAVRPIAVPQITSVNAVTTVSDAVLSGASGKTVTISSAGGNLPSLAVGDHVLLQAVSVYGANSPYRVTSVVTDTEEYVLAKLNDGDAVDVVSESLDVEETIGLVKMEAENPELHVYDFSGAFSIEARYSTDGSTWNDATAITAEGVDVVPFKVVWARMFVNSITTSIDAGWVV